jgi:hypothetical protein
MTSWLYPSNTKNVETIKKVLPHLKCWNKPLDKNILTYENNYCIKDKKILDVKV